MTGFNKILHKFKNKTETAEFKYRSYLQWLSADVSENVKYSLKFWIYGHLAKLLNEKELSVSLSLQKFTFFQFILIQRFASHSKWHARKHFYISKRCVAQKASAFISIRNFHPILSFAGKDKEGLHLYSL